MEQHTKILIIEDHDIIVWALTSVIEKDFADAMFYSASDFTQGLRILERGPVDLIVLDVDLSGGNTPTMISDLRNIQPGVQILVYTGLTDEDDSLKYLAAGANGFLSKKAPFSTVSDVMRLVLNGGRYLSSSLQNAITEKYLGSSSKPAKNKRNCDLTTREKEVAVLLLKGKWTKEIADELGLKLTTVSTHKGNIFEKFEVDNSIELFRKIQKVMPELLQEI
jgi:two-component system invasion response regulator UvrY